MDQENHPIQLILKCNLKGMAEEVVHDNIGFFQSTSFPAGMHYFVAPQSIEAFGKFWVNITNNAMEENVAMHLKFNNVTIKFSCSGYLLRDKVLLCGNTELSAVEKVLEDIIIINNDVKNLLSKKIEESQAVINTDPLPVVKGASTGFQQVFQNLISNAIKFVPAERQPIIKIEAKNQGNYWQISVTDNGVGIPEEKQQDIFKLFQRTGEQSQLEGSGMGLAIVKRIIENNRGEIWFDSTADQGSTFYFTLPKGDDGK